MQLLLFRNNGLIESNENIYILLQTSKEKEINSNKITIIKKQRKTHSPPRLLFYPIPIFFLWEIAIHTHTHTHTYIYLV